MIVKKECKKNTFFSPCKVIYHNSVNIFYKTKTDLQEKIQNSEKAANPSDLITQILRNQILHVKKKKINVIATFYV